MQKNTSRPAYLRIAACVPVVRLGDVRANADTLIAMATEAAAQGASVIYFPQDALTGATLGVLKNQEPLRRQLASARRRIARLERRLGVLVEYGSADPALVTRYGRRKEAALAYTARKGCSLVYCNAGFGESTTDMVYDGAAFIAENGVLLAEAERFSLSAQMIIAQIHKPLVPWREVAALWPSPLPASCGARPFIPDDPAELRERCAEIFRIQVAGLLSRLVHVGCRKVVLGVSGGLDSTMALLVCCRTFDRMGLDRRGILAVTMPGFGTTSRTRDNARALMDALGVDTREIDIRASVSRHFHDIGYDPDKQDVTFENAQARERTQILMDLANDIGGLVVGTGDLSELALGWCTFNGDQMSMYGVNAGVPKTLMQEMVRQAAEQDFPEAAAILQDIVATPISPELLPGVQPTESLVGPYILHDFFLFHFVHGRKGPKQIRTAAREAFAPVYDAETIDRWLRVFLRRFLGQQFKRSCSPDGPAVGSISLSPRSGFTFPSDVRADAWLADLD